MFDVGMSAYIFLVESNGSKKQRRFLGCFNSSAELIHFVAMVVQG
ncbi:Ubiquitin receptor RAD23 (DNA repair protein RAD23) [Psidium guajava]|nr:Ubiquitin receptor RAD23 (DNA repair protein RAD23) [Psidium guajava]